MNILALITHTTNLTFRKVSNGEYCGPCPFCQTGDDRFRLWPFDDNPRYWCRVCDTKGDAIQFCRDFLGMGFQEACRHVGQSPATRTATRAPMRSPSAQAQPVSMPADIWLRRAQAFGLECQHCLSGPKGERARGWLHQRGLTAETIQVAGLGLNPADRYESRAQWGLPERTQEEEQTKGVWLPKGVVIPWLLDGRIGRINIRRPVGEPKYYQLPGGMPIALYNADAVTVTKAAMLVEGEFDALTILQEAGDLIVPVATGTTMGARRAKWIARLYLPPTVLVAFDQDANGAGDRAAQFWIDRLPNARRWRPFWSDPNAMLQDGVNLRTWVAAGLGIDKGGASAVLANRNETAQSQPPDSRPSRLAALTGRPLSPAETQELRALAQEEGVALAWETIDLNA